MTARIGCAALLAGLAGCASPPADRAAFHVVSGFDMAPYGLHEECVQVRPGERLEYVFDSNQAVHFDLHYREGGATLLPITRDNVREDAGVYPVAESQRLCLGWEAGAAGARLGYRFRIRPPE